MTALAYPARTCLVIAARLGRVYAGGGIDQTAIEECVRRGYLVYVGSEWLELTPRQVEMYEITEAGRAYAALEGVETEGGSR